ncbi:DNA mismatch repair endonuclease MutL [Eubacterium sp. MSJ-21]|nr:DNA mismatch repair endonuclease MutL [Eubacterium sp. MSJ-21]
MIRVLDKATIDKIAAGEVIERPSSVVKELLENAIDAGSTAVTVEIKDGGTSFIRVTDNGCGIPKEEVRMAYMRHATSKIEHVEDLNSILSLGFRGEALSTIAAVSQTEMITKTATDLTGIKYVIHGGKEIEYKDVGVPNGTTIVVRNLFFNTPARKKFLKSAMTEGSYIFDLLTRIALSHPEISFKLIANGQTRIDTSGNGKLKDTIYQLYGRDITANLIPIDYTDGDIHLSGFIGKPFIARGNRGLENYFINHRYIKSNVVNRAIEEGYRTFVMQHKFPFTVLYLDLPQEKCDVNVHPTKMEFKYDNEKKLFEACCTAVKLALTHKEIIPKEGEKPIASPVISHPEQKPAEPFEVRRAQAQTIPQKNVRAGSYSPTYKILESLRKAEEEEAAKNGTPLPNIADMVADAGVVYAPSTTTESAQTGNSATASKVTQQSGSITPSQPMQQNHATTTAQTARQSSNSPSAVSQPVQQNNSAETVQVTQTVQPDCSTAQAQPSGASAKQDLSKMDKNSAAYKYTVGKQETLFDDDFLTEKARLSHRVIGQVFETYWLIEYNDNLYIMDQHAAHEKVKYEELMENLKNKQVFSQQLLPPMVITVTYAERQAILDNFDLFMKIGYDIEEFGGNEFKINAIPSNLFGLHGRDMFLEFVGSLIQNSGYMSNDIFIKKLSTMACKAAVKGNMKLSFQEIDALVDKLLSLENPYTCPHGRPTIISMSKTELEKKFHRIVS